MGAFLRNAVRHKQRSLQRKAGIIWRSSEEWQVPPAVLPDATGLDGAWHCAAEAAVGKPARNPSRGCFSLQVFSRVTSSAPRGQSAHPGTCRGSAGVRSSCLLYASSRGLFTS